MPDDTAGVNPSRPVDLYRFYDANGLLLYIGVSLHAAQRASQHKREKPWWGDVARMEVEHLAMTREAAEHHEMQAIRQERPMHNIQHSSFDPSTGWVPVGYPVQIGHVYAFGRSGRELATVGLVSGAWLSNADDTAVLRVELYSWLSGLFGYEWVAFEWSPRGRLLEATYTVDRQGDKVFDMDPLSDFQDEWRRLWDCERP